MKKKFYPFGALSLFLVMPSLLGVMALGGWFTYRIVGGMINNFKPASIFGLILGIAVFLVGAVYAIVFFRIRLVIFDDRIRAKGELRLTAKSPIIQHDVDIFFDEIENIALIYEHGDSKGKRIKIYTAAQAFRAYFYFEFLLKDGGTKRIYIEPYAKWQRKQLLAIINERTGHNFSYKTLERRDESMFARKKKK